MVNQKTRGAAASGGKASIPPVSTTTTHPRKSTRLSTGKSMPRPRSEPSSKSDPDSLSNSDPDSPVKTQKKTKLGPAASRKHASHQSALQRHISISTDTDPEATNESESESESELPVKTSKAKSTKNQRKIVARLPTPRKRPLGRSSTDIRSESVCLPLPSPPASNYSLANPPLGPRHLRRQRRRQRRRMVHQWEIQGPPRRYLQNALSRMR